GFAPMVHAEAEMIGWVGGERVTDDAEGGGAVHVRPEKEKPRKLEGEVASIRSEIGGVAHDPVRIFDRAAKVGGELVAVAERALCPVAARLDGRSGDAFAEE